MSIVVRSIRRQDMPQVIDMLVLNVSSFSPDPLEYDRIWGEYNFQKCVFGVVACENANIVGYGSVVIETKIRGGKVAHVEDIVCAAEFRRRGIGSKILDALLAIAIDQKCYKSCLACPEHVAPFYAKNGYTNKETHMIQYL